MKKILLVEDYETARQALADLLRRFGYEVSETASGVEALQLVRREQPQLVLLDMNLPDLNGIEVCQRLKADPATAATLVLALSGHYTGSEDKVYGLDSGADGYLFKPVETAELLATIRALFRLHQAEEEARRERLLAEASAARFRGLVDSLKAIVWEADARTQQFTFVNRRAEEILGFPLARWLAEPAFWRNLIHLDDREAAVNLRRGAVAAGRDHDFEYRVTAADGREVWLRDMVFVEKNEQGQAARLNGVMIDITKRKQVQLEREQLLQQEQALREQAEEASRLKDEFLTSLSHELRTPLHLILGNLQLLNAGGQPTEATQVLLETALRQAEKLRQTVTDLLDTAEVMTGKMRLKTEPLDFIPLIEAVSETFRPALEARGLSLKLLFDHRARVLTGDSARLQQIVWHLLSNAVKFTPPGGAVEVRLAYLDSEVELSVSDTGVGVKPEFLPFVFDRFRQADGSHTRRFGGLGLGLAVVRHLVELHGGSVAATSAGEGRGATFTVRLPVSGALVRYGER